jgi:hypothetical protein
MAKSPRRPATPEDDPENSSGSDYEVGYGRPPKDGRFKSGKSGNPNGRPKGQRNLRTVLEETLKQRVKVREGDRVRSLSKLDSVVLNIVHKAIQGDPKAQVNLINLMRSVGLAAEPPAPSNREPVTTHDTDIVADFLRRHMPTADDATSSDDPTDNQGTESRKKESKS